jgi:hypothetical protein
MNKKITPRYGTTVNNKKETDERCDGLTGEREASTW